MTGHLSYLNVRRKRQRSTRLHLGGQHGGPVDKDRPPVRQHAVRRFGTPVFIA